LDDDVVLLMRLRRPRRRETAIYEGEEVITCDERAELEPATKARATVVFPAPGGPVTTIRSVTWLFCPQPAPCS